MQEKQKGETKCYFTGTGNSLYIAKQIEENPVSIPQIMQQDNLTFSADRIGIFAPIYGHEVPPMVRDFLKKLLFIPMSLN